MIIYTVPNCIRCRRTANRHMGQQHLDYLKQYRKVTYTNLLTSGKLNTYLADINRQAQERFERLIEGMKQAQGITEQLKEENAFRRVKTSVISHKRFKLL